MEPSVQDMIAKLRDLGNAANREGMARYGIRTDRALGISVRTLREIARGVGREHELALGLWSSGIHEARMLAVFVADPARYTPELMDAWVADFDSWDITDQCCNHLFRRTPHAREAVERWSRRNEEFVRRAAFALMASLAVHDRGVGPSELRAWLRLIRDAAEDDRNFVRKAVNWALRQIGKRHLAIYPEALALADELASGECRAARWIGRDAARELRSEAVLRRHGLEPHS